MRSPMGMLSDFLLDALDASRSLDMVRRWIGLALAESYYNVAYTVWPRGRVANDPTERREAPMKGDVEDWLTDLPPLDGADDETDESSPEADELLPEEDSATLLDDATAEDLEIGDSIEIADAETGEADDDAWQADVGEAEIDTAGDEEPWTDAEGEGPTAADSDLDIEDEPEDEDEDRGEEGTADPIEYSLDEELPELDADADGDFEDALLSELRRGDTNAPARFADRVWETTVYSAWGGPDEDDEIAAMLVQVAPDLLVALTSAGNVLMSGDGRTSAVRVGAIPDEVRSPDGRVFLACSGVNPVLWIADSRGKLVKSADLGQSWELCAGPGRPILALATHEDGTLSALAQEGTTAEILTSRDGVRWFAQRIGVELPADMHGRKRASLWICHRGVATAIGEPFGVWVSREGTAFARVAGSAGATAGAFAGSTSQAPLLIAGAPSESHPIQLFRVARGEAPEIIVELEPRGMSGEGAALGMAWDEASGGARLAFATEVVLVKPRTPLLI